MDASNMWEAQKTKGKLLDLQKLSNFIRDTYGVPNVEFFYYAAYPANGTRSYSMDGKHKFFTFLSKGLGFNVNKKELKRITVDEHGTIEEKGNMDVEITIDVVRNIDKYDTAILFSGDSDFLALCTFIKNAGKKVFIYSSKNNVSSELKTGGSGYIDILKDIHHDIWGNDLKYREQK